eukprot:scaffold106555_cov33-Tisochrysis_lutea.AAC.6
MYLIPATVTPVPASDVGSEAMASLTAFTSATWACAQGGEKRVWGLAGCTSGKYIVWATLGGFSMLRAVLRTANPSE